MIKNSSKKDVDVLFNSLVEYKIPKYQRDYKWSKDEAEQFLEDFVESNNVFSPQYLGVLVTSPDYGDSLQTVHEVIDGQQRITTLFILFCAIRKYAKDFELNNIISNIEQKIFYHTGVERKYKIDTHDYLHLFFDNILEDSESSIIPRGKSIKYVYDTFLSYLEENISPESLEGFYRAIIKSEFVHIEIGSASPFEVFERTNSRGVDLTVSDLLKNKLFLEANRVDNLNQIQDRWDIITENAGLIYEKIKKLKFTTLIRYFYISRFGHITEKKLYKKIVEKYTDFYENDIDRFVSDFESSVNLLIILSKNRQELSSDDILKIPGRNSDRGYLRTILSLKEFAVIQPYSLLLSLFAKERDMDLRTWLNKIEVFHFVYSYISNGPAREFEKKYSETAEKVYNANSLKEVQSELNKLIFEFSRLVKNITTREKFIKDVSGKLKYGRDSNAIRFYYEYLEEEHFNRNLHGDTFIGDSPISLDHVLAQNIAENHSLGNIIVLSKDINQQVQDKDFKKKREIILNSNGIQVTRYMYEKYEDWNDASISEWGEESAGMFWDSVVKKYFNLD